LLSRLGDAVVDKLHLYTVDRKRVRFMPSDDHKGSLLRRQPSTLYDRSLI